MNRDDVLTKLQEIFADLLDDETFELTEELSMETLSDWDSLFHITLIAAIEDEFKIKIATDDIPKAKKVNIIIDLIMQGLKKQ